MSPFIQIFCAGMPYWLVPSLISYSKYQLMVPGEVSVDKVFSMLIPLGHTFKQ